jgi:hypothetical protein
MKPGGTGGSNSVRGFCMFMCVCSCSMRDLDAFQHLMLLTPDRMFRFVYYWPVHVKLLVLLV